MTVLLDANILIALVVSGHVNHDRAEAWLTAHRTPFATCPSTQGSLLRLLVRGGQELATALAVLASLTSDSRHEFWADDLSFEAVPTSGVIGHRQVTDAYLAQLARHHRGRLATFDAGLAALHADVADLVPALS